MKHLTRLALAGMLVTGAPVLAHHALHSEYSTSKRGQVQGEKLTRFALINPHVRWYFDVKESQRHHQPNGK